MGFLLCFSHAKSPADTFSFEMEFEFHACTAQNHTKIVSITFARRNHPRVKCHKVLGRKHIPGTDFVANGAVNHWIVNMHSMQVFVAYAYALSNNEAEYTLPFGFLGGISSAGLFSFNLSGLY